MKQKSGIGCVGGVLITAAIVVLIQYWYIVLLVAVAVISILLIAKRPKARNRSKMTKLKSYPKKMFQQSLNHKNYQEKIFLKKTNRVITIKIQ
ncbi:hypothetical protein [Lacticaseibacillus paracasei]|uniref:hypothetical protein n=1 Tax=Lacticaseibacillus paracasei TaxID=1597 RepID=UPI003087EDCC|nr:hypothetical protein SGY26_10900 [Lacticaseibacillus paracasei]WQG46290.1 hypothetical protein U2Q69_09130 [Lacticaseibacillus casei]